MLLPLVDRPLPTLLIWELHMNGLHHLGIVSDVGQSVGRGERSGHGSVMCVGRGVKNQGDCECCVSGMLVQVCGSV